MSQYNPFDLIDSRLSRIENLLLDLKHGSLEPSIDPSKFYTPRQAAEKLSLSVATVYGKMSSGELAYSKKGGRAYILQSDIDTYLQDGRKPSNSEISQRNYLK